LYEVDVFKYNVWLTRSRLSSGIGLFCTGRNFCQYFHINQQVNNTIILNIAFISRANSIHAKIAYVLICSNFDQYILRHASTESDRAAINSLPVIEF